jgi:hypothetical protein
MTDDVVARLRDTHPNFDEKPMCEEAAAEIERLRVVLGDVIDAWDWWRVDTYDRCASVVSDAVMDARAALAGEKANG